jgi:hypothetical protein
MDAKSEIPFNYLNGLPVCVRYAQTSAHCLDNYFLITETKYELLGKAYYVNILPCYPHTSALSLSRSGGKVFDGLFGSVEQE